MKVIFFDAVGTLFRLTGSVGQHYARVAADLGERWDPVRLDAAFLRSWKQMPARSATGIPRPDDDKGWWRELVGHVLEEVAHDTNFATREKFFELAYAHFAAPGVWQLFPETLDVLRQLQPHCQLVIISNFDGRLRPILADLGLAHCFTQLCLSSELGADKPDPFIFESALKLAGVSADEALHVGDDPVRDWQGAEAAGIAVFRLDRPRNSLRELLADSRLQRTGNLRAPIN